MYRSKNPPTNSGKARCLPAGVILLLLAFSLILPRTAPAAGTWSETGSLATARNSHTATRLADGQVLVAGGLDAAADCLASAERFDPVLGTWSATGNLATARKTHTATRLADGRVLVAGGWGAAGYLASAERFDPAFGTWSGTGSLGIGRSGHTSTLLADGRVLVAGGSDGLHYFNYAEIFWPALGTWASGGFAANVRSGHTATLLADGRVMVAGGYGGFPGFPYAILGDAEYFNPGNWRWDPAGFLATARDNHTATLLTDGRVLVAGGWSGSMHLASAELFNPVAGTWIGTGSLATARSGHTATLLADGRVLVAGGWSGSMHLASAELFNPATGTWSATGNLATARGGHTATLLADGRVLVAGGIDSAGRLASAELYDPLNLVANGSFETASVDPGAGQITLPAGSNDIAHWTVLGAGIDYSGGYWQPAEGRRSLDLNALDSGSIWTTFETLPGARYIITFALAGNPDGGPAVKSLRVILGGKFQDFFFDTTGKSRADMGWATKSCTLTSGEGGTTNLIFQSYTSGPYGPALDKVRVIRAKPVVPPLLLLLD